MQTVGLEPMGGTDEIVDVDETFIGRVEGVPKQKAGAAHKNVVLTLVERGGSARSFHIDSARRADVKASYAAITNVWQRLSIPQTTSSSCYIL
jgi:hypothetical protein